MPFGQIQAARHVSYTGIGGYNLRDSAWGKALKPPSVNHSDALTIKRVQKHRMCFWINELQGT